MDHQQATRMSERFKKVGLLFNEVLFDEHDL